MSISTLHSFTGIAPDGENPYASVIYQNGILYGTTYSGGNAGGGTLFEYNLTTGINTTLHYFTGTGTDGLNPYASVIYQNGILYGTTISGGNANVGTLFKYNLTTGINTTLHSFTGTGTDGINPVASIIYQNGILYGTTISGGNTNGGTLFEYNLATNNYNTLYSFTGIAPDGENPYASVIYQNGILYGTTLFGGNANGGTLFKYNLTTGINTTLHSFTGTGTDGIFPVASIIYQNGILYGTTINDGGISDGGTLFKFDLTSSNFDILHFFTGAATDGLNPYASVIYQNGILYGTTRFGGGISDGGTLFEYDLTTGIINTLHSFTGPTTDGSTPTASVIYQNGILYGTTLFGGNTSGGTLFSYELPIQPPIICNPCPPRALPTPGVAFGGTENIVGFEATQAYRYQSLVSLPFTSRASGSTQIINTPLNKYGYKCAPPPPRNRFG